MNSEIIEYLHKCFELLINKYGFRKQNEIVEGDTYEVEYSSPIFVLKIEKYRGEFYVTIKKQESDREINLFNLLAFLFRDSKDAPKSNYFKHETNTQLAYKKQLQYISTVLYDNFDAIQNSMEKENYDQLIGEIEAYMIHKYPELFRR